MTLPFCSVQTFFGYVNTYPKRTSEQLLLEVTRQTVTRHREESSVFPFQRFDHCFPFGHSPISVIRNWFVQHLATKTLRIFLGAKGADLGGFAAN